MERMWVVLTVLFAAMALLFLVEVHRMMDRYISFVGTVSTAIEERDARLYRLQNRVLILEEQREVEGRVTDLEVALRTYCLDGKTAMCGKLGPVGK